MIKINTAYRMSSCIGICAIFGAVLAAPAIADPAIYDSGDVWDINPPAMQSTGGSGGLEKTIGANDMEPIADLPASDVFRVHAKPVGRFAYREKSGGIGYCTASLIADDLLLTNHHCRAEKEAVLLMGYLDALDGGGASAYPVVLPALEDNKQLDYAIYRVRGEPGDRWGKVTFSPKVPAAKSSLFMVHHPEGFPQRITRGRCQAADPATKGDDLLHTCDTLRGSSGAPIFEAGDRKVIGLHYRAVGLESLNAGIQIASIAKSSEIIGRIFEEERLVVKVPPVGGLVDISGGGSGTIVPSADAAEKAYNAAKAIGTKEAFEAVVRRYPDTLWSDLATAVITKLEGGEEEKRRKAIAAQAEREAEARIAAAQAASRQALLSSSSTAPSSRSTGSSSSLIRGSVPGSVFTEFPGGPEMVVIPSGRFEQGSPAGEAGLSGHEGPQREVRIPNPFALGRSEVTVGEWRRFVNATGHVSGNSCQTLENSTFEDRPGLGWNNPGFSQSDSHPVTCVNWDDAQEYVSWLNSRVSGSPYRLPSESEWEYAARGGTVSSYPWGSRDSHEQANYGSEDCCSGMASGRDRWLNTSSVGSFPSNPFDLHDMLGNVSEWTEDCWHEGYSGAPANGLAWLSSSGGDCDHRVLRGGSWLSRPRVLRSANRGWGGTSYRVNVIGFRVARTLTR